MPGYVLCGTKKKCGIRKKKNETAKGRRGKERKRTVSNDVKIFLRVDIGKFTRTGKFRLHVTALNVIAPHARYKVRSLTPLINERTNERTNVLEADWLYCFSRYGSNRTA